MKKIGIDLGGTKIEGIVLNENFEEEKRIRVPTNASLGYDSILENIKNLISKLQEGLKDDEIKIGICTPGSISKKSNLLENSNTLCLNKKPFKEDLEKKLNQRVFMENDANCFALAEANLGSAKEFGIVFGVIMGTGVGAGICIQGKLLSGRNNTAGEWGHHILHRGGNPCFCGNFGCVETYLCGPALEKQWTNLTGESIPLSSIVTKVENPQFERWKGEFLENFGAALANVVDILDPDVIVLGGGVSNVPFIYDEGKKKVQEKVFADFIDTPIIKNDLGDSAGVFGACLLD